MTAPKYSLDGNIFTITKSDSAILRVPPDMIWCGVKGDLVVLTSQGETITFKNAEGWMHTPAITKVLAATTATDLVGVASKAMR